MRELFFQAGGHPGALELCAWIAGVALAGRIVLSFLPPGPPGFHAPRDIAATWAASHLLGFGLLAAWALLERRVGVALPWWPLPAMLAIGCAARIVTLPGKMVPRHEPALEGDAWIARVLRLLAITLLASTAFSFEDLRSDQVSAPSLDVLAGMSIASAFAGLVLVSYALETARAATWMRASGCVAFAAILVARGFEDEGGLAVESAVCFLAGACFTVAWLRRADRRALILALIFFALAPAFALVGIAPSIAGIGAIVLGTPRASRARVASLALVAATLAGAFAWPAFARTNETPLAGLGVTRPLEALPYRTWALQGTQALAGVLFLVVLFARWKALQLRGREQPTTSGAPRGHEEAVLLRAIVAAMLLNIALEKLLARELGDPLLPSMSVLALVAALSLKRFTRTASGA